MRNDTRKFASVGIDLGDLESHYVCLDEAAKVVRRGRVAMTVGAFRREFGGFERTCLAMEVGAQSRWVKKELEALGHDVIVANPRQVKLISASQSKTDANDAALLARLARVDRTLLAPVDHRGEELQMDLAMIRARALLVGQRAALMTAVKGIAKGFGIRLPSATSDRYVERAMGCLPDGLRVALAGQFGMIVALSEQIEGYDEQIEATALARYPQVARLRSVPGVGTLTAMTFVLTLARAERFSRSRDVGGCVGLRPRKQQSGSRDPQLGITKAGDGYLRKLLVQSAHCILREKAPDSALKRWGLQLCQCGGKNAKKRAVVAVARKLAVLLHRLWAKGETYRAFPVTQPKAA